MPTFYQYLDTYPIASSISIGLQIAKKLTSATSETKTIISELRRILTDTALRRNYDNFISSFECVETDSIEDEIQEFKNFEAANEQFEKELSSEMFMFGAELSPVPVLGECKTSQQMPALEFESASLDRETIYKKIDRFNKDLDPRSQVNPLDVCAFIRDAEQVALNKITLNDVIKAGFDFNALFRQVKVSLPKFSRQVTMECLGTIELNKLTALCHEYISNLLKKSLKAQFEKFTSMVEKDLIVANLLAKVSAITSNSAQQLYLGQILFESLSQINQRVSYYNPSKGLVNGLKEIAHQQFEAVLMKYAATLPLSQQTALATAVEQETLQNAREKINAHIDLSMSRWVADYVRSVSPTNGSPRFFDRMLAASKIETYARRCTAELGGLPIRAEIQADLEQRLREGHGNTFARHRSFSDDSTRCAAPLAVRPARRSLSINISPLGAAGAEPEPSMAAVAVVV